MVEIDAIRRATGAAISAPPTKEVEPRDSVRMISKTANNNNNNNQDEQIDFELVRQVRQMLESEFATDDKEKYSQSFYNDLMDERSPWTCWRYLLQCKGDADDALDLMKRSLVWRKEEAADEFSNREFAKEFWHYSPIAITGATKQGQDVVYIVGRNYRKPDSVFRSVIKRFVANLLLDWDKRHKHDLSQFVIVFDVTDTGFKNVDLDFMAWLVMLSDHVPSRIFQVYVVGIPFLIRPIVRLIISWLPENFRSIVHCGTVEQLIEPNIDQSSLPPEADGTLDNSFRLAPLDAPWSEDLALLNEPAMRKAFEYSIGFCVPGEKRNEMRALQLEYENKLLKR